MSIFELAKNPPKRNRPVPFWSWNDKLSAEECCHQIEMMHEQGIGGFFMHARGGLHTDYLSDEWFKVTQACVDKAKALGMNAWAYDENGWPSGFGGGLVNSKGLFYQQKYLRYKRIWDHNEIRKKPNKIGIFSTDGKKLYAKDEELPERTVFHVFYFEVNPYYVDTLDGRVIAEFLSSTHEKYNQILDSEQHKAMRGFFTDEPQVSRNGIPWSLSMPEEYEKRFGEPLLPLLPQLFFAWGCDYRRTRYRFWRMVTELFNANFVKQIHDWCEAHSWELTGHLVLEESFDYQIPSNGACMPHYEYFHIPGIDLLGRNRTWVSLPLQLFSAAAQTGKKQILTETFALCGWAVSFTDLQWLVQWQFVHGVNLVCQHLEGYSLRGIRKRDYPASLFRHQPWWKYYKPFNDYMSRVGTLLATGDVKYNVLLLHPITSGQMCYDFSTNGACIPYQLEFKDFSDFLESHHINHHYGDEILMERHGKVEDGLLKIGQQSYGLVILPKMSNLSSTQVALLSKFIKQGGKVMGLWNDLEPMPFAIDGEVGAELPFQDEIEWFDSSEALLEAIPQEFRPVRVIKDNGQDAETINCTSRTFADFDGKPAVFHYFVNNDRFGAVDTIVTVPAEGIEGYCTRTGEIYPLPYISDGKNCIVNARFTPAGDFALLARPYKTSVAPKSDKAFSALKLSNNWQLRNCTENLLTMDHCRCEVEGKELFEKEYVLTINDALLAKEKENLPIALEFTFQTDADFDTSKPLTLLVEHPERQKIFVNGTAVSNKPNGFFADPAFERIDITGTVRTGKNTIRLEMVYHQFPETFECLRAAKIFESEKNKLSLDSEIESIYLAGEFGVKTPGEFTKLSDDSCRYNGEFILTKRPSDVAGDHLEESGLTFFAGEATIAQTVKLTTAEAAAPQELRFDMFYGSVLVCKVNGKEIGILTRPDYRLEIPEGLLVAGDNDIELTVVTSLRNMLGPHHLEDGDSHAVSPRSFYKTAGGPFSSGGVEKWNDGYCFVRHGIR